MEMGGGREGVRKRWGRGEGEVEERREREGSESYVHVCPCNMMKRNYL